MLSDKIGRENVNLSFTMITEKKEAPPLKDDEINVG